MSETKAVVISTEGMVHGGQDGPLPRGTYTVTINAITINQKKDSDPPVYWASVEWEILQPDTVQFAGKTLAVGGRTFKTIQSLDPAKPKGLGAVDDFCRRMGVHAEVFPEGNFNSEAFVKNLTGKVFDAVLEAVEHKPRAPLTEAERAEGKKQGEVLKTSDGVEIKMGWEVVMFKGLSQVIRVVDLKELQTDVAF